MCVFLSLRMNKAQIKKQFDLKDLEGEYFGPKYIQSAFEFKTWPVVASEKPNLLESMNWGLIPSWVRSELEAIKLRSKTVNARIETASEKPSFKQAVKQKRCLVLVDGFYEFRELNKKKYPYFIKLKEQSAFAMAGLYAEWANPSSGEIIRSFSILTTEANSLMQKIHNRKKRMPVILPSGDETSWLDFSLNTQSLKSSYPSESMEAWTVSRLLTDRSQDKNIPEVQVFHEYPEIVFADGLNI